MEIKEWDNSDHCDILSEKDVQVDVDKLLMVSEVERATNCIFMSEELEYTTRINDEYRIHTKHSNNAFL